MKITLICVGRLKEKYWVDAVAEYVKRLGRYARVQVVEVPDEPTPDNISSAQAQQVKEKEGQKILAKLPADAYAVALAIEGKTLTSEGLSAFMDKRFLEGKSHLAFIIGGSLGLSPAVMQRADFALSFSPMTFPHQLMRVLVLEQVYRGFKISAGEPYHK